MNKPIEQRIIDSLKECMEHLDLVLELHRDGYPLRPSELEEIQNAVTEAKQLLAYAHARRGQGGGR